MQKYHFDIIGAGKPIRDETGTDLADDDQARHEAISLLPALARDMYPDGDRHEIVVTVRDEEGRVVYEAGLALHGRWWPGRR